MKIIRTHLAPNRVWAIPVRDNGKRTTLYTEQLPFVPGAGVEQLGAPVEYAPIAQAAPEAEPVACEVEIPDIAATFDGLYLVPIRPLQRGDHLMTVAQHNRIMASAPQHDAELAELLSDAMKTIHGLAPERFAVEEELRAKLATLRHV